MDPMDEMDEAMEKAVGALNKVSQQQNTVAAINAYCRVLEIHTQAVAEAGIFEMPPAMKKALALAMENLAKEVEFLGFLRSAGK